MVQSKRFSGNEGVKKTNILGSYFTVHYPYLDHITNAVNHLGPQALSYKIDTSRAFRHLTIDPGYLLGLKHHSLKHHILGNFLSPVGVVRNLSVWFDSDFSFSRHVQNICKSCFAQIRVSEVTSHIMLPLWLRMLWLEVDLTTVIPCLEVSQLLIFVSCNVFKIVWLELSPTPPSTHTSLLLGRFYIGCLLNNAPYLRLLYWCTSS